MNSSPQKNRVVPKFETEKEEANWWFENQHRIAEDFDSAAEQGELKRLGKGRMEKRLATRGIVVRDSE